MFPVAASGIPLAWNRLTDSRSDSGAGSVRCLPPAVHNNNVTKLPLLKSRDVCLIVLRVAFITKFGADKTR